MPIDSLIALSELRRARRLNVRELAHAIQKDEVAARSVLARLEEAKLVTVSGTGEGHEGTLTPAVYRRLGQASRYSDTEQEQMILTLLQQRRQITRQEAATLCRISEDQASRLLRRLVEQGKLAAPGRRGRGAAYTLLTT